MSSWGANTSDESKPKWLTAEEKTNVHADSRGWVYTNPNTGLEEVLVAIGELSGTAKLAAATISSGSFKTASFSEAAGGNIDVTIVYNEKVTVTTTGGTPSIVISNDQAGSGTAATLTASYQSGSSTNKLVFRATVGAAAGTVAEDDVLSIGDQNIVLNGGTITDADGNAEVAISGVTDTLTAEA
jgi:hypothetical protein